MAIGLLSASQLWGEDSRGSLSIILENDQFGAGTDIHYTHGTEISYVSDTYVPRWLAKTADLFPLTSVNTDTRYGWNVEQKIYTPDNIETSTLIEDDRPYAGWLFFGLGLITKSGIFRAV